MAKNGSFHFIKNEMTTRFFLVFRNGKILVQGASIQYSFHLRNIIFSDLVIQKKRSVSERLFF